MDLVLILTSANVRSRHIALRAKDRKNFTALRPTLNFGSAYRATADETDRVGGAAHELPDVIVPLQDSLFLDSRRIRWPIGGRFCLGMELGDLPLDGCMKP